MQWVVPHLAALQSLVVAELDATGRALAANAGFLRLVAGHSADVPGLSCAQFFFQPTFADLLALPTDPEGLAFAGLLTLGCYPGDGHTLHAKVYRTEGQLRVLAEPAIADFEQLQASLVALNTAYADAQLAVVRLNHELQRCNTSLEQQVVERTDQLSDALVAVAASNNAKREFLANVNHELRTPVHQIHAHAELLLSEPATQSAHQLQSTAQIRHTSEHLLRVVDRILAMTRQATVDPRLAVGDFGVADFIGLPAAQQRTAGLAGVGASPQPAGDTPTVAQACAELAHYLRDSDPYSFELFTLQHELLRAELGDGLDAVGAALDAVDFAGALLTLRTAAADRGIALAA